jgi:hypothetical protein
MSQALPEIERVSRPRHIIRDLALDALLGAAILATCAAGFAWLFLEMGGGR